MDAVRFDVLIGPRRDPKVLGWNFTMADAKALILTNPGAYQMRHDPARKIAQPETAPQPTISPSPSASKSGKKFYAILPNDPALGEMIIEGWAAAKPLIDGKSVQHKGFKDRDAAENWLKQRKADRVAVAKAEKQAVVDAQFVIAATYGEGGMPAEWGNTPPWEE